MRTVVKKKIVILGCENSHADSFLKYITTKSEFADIEVVGVYSEQKEKMEKLHERFGVNMLSSYDEAVGNVDGVMITARHGNLHYRYAKPYIASGVPMFIDKPITIAEDEAIMFMQELKEQQVRITGGSSLKHDIGVVKLKGEAQDKTGGETIGGIVRAPYMPDSPYGGFYFYAQHLVEIVCEIFGRTPKSVRVSECGNNLTVLFRYEGFDVTGLYVKENYQYYAARFSEEGISGYMLECGGDNDWFYHEFQEFYQLLSGAQQTISYTDFIAPVFIMNAIERAWKSGNEEMVACNKLKGGKV